MLFEQWSMLMDELKIIILTELVYSDGFPHTLLQVTSASGQSNAYAKDFTIWQAALRFYFPIAEKAFPSEFKNSAFTLFKNFYIACSKVMADKNSRMSDYIVLVQADWKNIPAEKKDILIGLALVSGFKHKIDKKDITMQAKSNALLFASSLGLKSQIDLLLSLSGPAIGKEYVRSGLQWAAEFGHVIIFAHYILHANTRLDLTSKRAALLKAAANGHLSIIKLIAQSPDYLNGAIFALRKAVIIASENGHVEVLGQLISRLNLAAETTTLQSALKIACDKGHACVVSVILQRASAQINDTLIVELFKKTVIKGDVDIAALFFQYTNNSLSDLMVLESLRHAITRNQENTIMLILLNRHTRLSTYFKRQIFIEASRNGLLSVVRFLLEKESNVIGKTFIAQGLSAANANNHSQVEALLGGRAPELDEVASLTGQMGDLSLASQKMEMMAAYVPGYQSLTRSRDSAIVENNATCKSHLGVRLS